MNKTQEFLKKACEELGIKILINESIVLGSGSTINVDAHIVGIGPPQGMLVFSANKLSDEARKQLIDLGYGLSSFNEPSQNEDFDISSYIEMFSEWNGGALEGSQT